MSLELKTWDQASGRLIRRDALDVLPPMALSSDGKFIVAEGHHDEGARISQFLQVIDLETRKRVSAIPLESSSPVGNCLAISPDCKRVVIGINAGREGRTTPDGAVEFTPYEYLRVLAVPSLKPIGTPIKITGDGIYDVSFTAEGKKVISSCGSEKTLVHDVATGRVVRTVNGMTVDTVGGELAATLFFGKDKVRCEFWRPADGSSVARWFLPDSMVKDGARFLVRIHPDRTKVAFWDANSKEVQIYPLPKP